MSNNSASSLSDNAEKSISIFENPEFGKVRTVVINNEPYFVGKDIVDSLGYTNSRKALSDHVDEEDKGVTKCYTPSGIQNMTIINESGLYSLILGSKLPSAKKFKHWVTNEVLPSIRKSGSYQVMPQKTEREMNIEEAHILENLILLCPVETYRQILASHITKKVTGEFLLPLPKLKNQIMTASQIADELHISKKRVGEIANKNNLKTEENGEWIWDRAANGKQVKNFVYNSKGFEAIKEFVNA